jgi:MoxR-like ATPase
MEQLNTIENYHSKIQALIDNIELVVKGKNDKIKLVLTCLFAGGHVLIEDNPGTGKTVLAKTLAKSIYYNDKQVFKRVQFTPDLLPMDLLGAHIYDENSKEFIFKKGPLFCNILLADEINRASPKVQSALLECMAEGQITAGEITYQLEKVFFTIATQNPIEMEGTYPLPAAQLDRFYMKINFGYVDAKTELDILQNYNNIHTNLNNPQSVISTHDIEKIQEQVQHVTVHPEILASINNIVQNSRNDDAIKLGISTRAAIALIKCIRAYAYLDNRNYVNEADIQEIIPNVMNHRLIFNSKEAEKTWLNNQINKELERLRKIK